MMLRDVLNRFFESLQRFPSGRAAFLFFAPICPNLSD
jgi:hypothetical protein